MSSEGYSDDIVSEPVPIEDTFITGLHKVEFLGDHNVRIYLYAEEDGIRVIKAKLVGAVDAIPVTITAVMKAAWHRVPLAPLMEADLGSRRVRN